MLKINNSLNITLNYKIGLNVKQIIYFFFLLLLIIIFTNFVCVSAAGEDFKSLLDLSKEAYDKKEYKASIVYSEKVIEMYPNSERIENAKEVIVESYIKLGKFKKARAILNDLQKEYPESKNNDFWELKLSYIEYKENKFETALEGFNNLVRNHPDSEYVPNALFLASHMYRKLGDYNLAIKYAEKLIQNYPKSKFLEKAELAVSYNLIKKREYGKAAEKYKQFIDSHKGSKNLADAYCSLGRCYVSNRRNYPDDPKTAIKYFEKVINEFPNSNYASLAGFNIAFTYYKFKKYDQAISHFKDYIKKYKADGYGISLYYMAKSYQEKGNFEEAKKIFEQIIKRFPESKWAIRAKQIVGKSGSRPNKEKNPGQASISDR